MVGLDDEFGGVLGSGRSVRPEGLDGRFARARHEAADKTERELGRAGFYGPDIAPYPEPTTDTDAPKARNRPAIDAVRDVWIAKFNPASERWYDEQTGSSDSDVLDEALFPWSHPEAAARTGNFWLSTVSTPANRAGIERVQVGDLVVIQRNDPGMRHKHLRKNYGATDVLVGMAIVYAAEEWTDSTTQKRERQLCLLPAGRFRHEIPRTTARRHQRLRGPSFSRIPQTPDGSQRPGFTLSAVVGDDDTNELLAVCGIHPGALAEPDVARLCARLRSTTLGNRPLWRKRWDHVYRHAIRTNHEQAAVLACKKWATDHSYLFRCSVEYTANAGYDLLFVDGVGQELQVEVKGYVSPTLNAVHLQRSQAARATEASRGIPPEWRLYALLKVDTKRPTEVVRTAPEVVALLSSGGLQVR